MKEPIECPDCKTVMVAGRFHIGSTVIAFLLVGFSLKHLFFTNKAGKKHIAHANDDSRKGYYCPCCELHLIRKR